MKYAKTIKLAVGLVIMATLLSCSEDEPVIVENTLEEDRAEVLEALAVAPWEPTGVRREGVETSAYEGFQLEVKDGTFQTVNGGQAWPESGTWQFVDDQSNQILRDDGILMTVEIKGENVEISFTFEEEVFTGGRAKTVQTFIVFILTKFGGTFGSS